MLPRGRRKIKVKKEDLTGPHGKRSGERKKREKRKKKLEGQAGRSQSHPTERNIRHEGSCSSKRNPPTFPIDVKGAQPFLARGTGNGMWAWVGRDDVSDSVGQRTG